MLNIHNTLDTIRDLSADYRLACLKFAEDYRSVINFGESVFLYLPFQEGYFTFSHLDDGEKPFGLDVSWAAKFSDDNINTLYSIHFLRDLEIIARAINEKFKKILNGEEIF